MRTISIFGKGNMGRAIGDNFKLAGSTVHYIDKSDSITVLGDIVVLAVPYPSVGDILKKYHNLFAGKIVIDITNPLNFDTFDELVVPANSSAAAKIAEEIPEAKVVKGFNTTFAQTLVTKKIGETHTTTVLLASDSDDAKKSIINLLDGTGLDIADVGKLKRARELEALGFLQLTLASNEKIGWSGGFGLFK